MRETWLHVDWLEIFLLDRSPIEMIVRGTVIYFALFLLFRFGNKRQLGGLGISDLLLVVLVAEAANGGLAGDYTAIPSGGVLLLTLMFWNHALNWMDYHFPWFRRIYRAAPLELIRDGQILRDNLRVELITFEELMSKLRLQGVDDVARADSGERTLASFAVEAGRAVLERD